MADDLASGFNALYAPVKQAEAERKTTLTQGLEGLDTAVGKFEKDRAGAAAVPDEPKLPDAPQPNFGKDAMTWMAASAVIAGLAGALTRRHATNALAAFAGAVNGYRQGKMDVFEQQYRTWQAENQKQLEESKRLWQKRQAILEDDKLGIDVAMTKLRVLDTISQSNVGAQTAQVQNYTAYVQAHEIMGLRIQAAEQATERLEIEKRKNDDDFFQKFGKTHDVWYGQMQGLQGDLMKQKPANLTPEQWAQTPQYAQLYDKGVKDRGLNAGSGQLTPETAARIAKQVVAGDYSALQNVTTWGAIGSQNKAMIQNAITDEMTAQNKSPEEISAAHQQFQAVTSGERSVAVRAGNIELAVSEAKKMAALVIKASAAFPRTDFPPLNVALQAYETKTGDTGVVKYGAAINSFIQAYVRAVAPVGVPTDSVREHAYGVLSTAHSDAQMRSILDQLGLEMQAAQEAPEDVLEMFRGFTTGKGSLKQTIPALGGGEQQGGGKFVEGQVYTDAQGNKAKYQNGQWVPQ